MHYSCSHKTLQCRGGGGGGGGGGGSGSGGSGGGAGRSCLLCFMVIARQLLRNLRLSVAICSVKATIIMSE